MTSQPSPLGSLRPTSPRIAPVQHIDDELAAIGQLSTAASASTATAIVSSVRLGPAVAIRIRIAGSASRRVPSADLSPSVFVAST